MARSRYKLLVDMIAADIRAGRLPPGTRLPTHRQLAAREALALVTATRVYAELQAMGLVSGEAGRGTFVRETSLPPGLGIDQPLAAAGGRHGGHQPGSPFGHRHAGRVAQARHRCAAGKTAGVPDGYDNIPLDIAAV